MVDVERIRSVAGLRLREWGVSEYGILELPCYLSGMRVGCRLLFQCASADGSGVTVPYFAYTFRMATIGEGFNGTLAFCRATILIT
jgi:hypothetical protein